MRALSNHISVRTLLLCIAGIVLLFSCNSTEDTVYGDDLIEVHFFHLNTCSHCHDQMKFHETLIDQYPNVKIVSYELGDSSARDAFRDFATRLGGGLKPNRIQTPTTIIGDRFNVGFDSVEEAGPILENMVRIEQGRIMNSWTEEMKTTAELRKIN